MHTVAITAFYAGILALILVVLSVRVVITRVRSTSASGSGGSGEDRLRPVIRAQANFTEYVPLGVLLIGYLELTGSSANLIHGLGIALVVARILHPIGMRAKDGPNVFRVSGAVITWLVLLVAAIIAIMGFLSGASPES